VVQEARDLAAQGVKEIILVSQDTTSYGLDLGLSDGLARLLEALAEVHGIRWIRFLYLYPSLISERLLDVVYSSPSICNYVDMPLQHASVRILKAMRRGGDRRSLSKLVGRIRQRIPDVTFRTTMIVGFPGETERDFQELYGFCREMEFDRLGVFTYSHEENTTAYDLTGEVPARTAERRRRVLMELQSEIAARKNRSLVGKEYPLLVEGPSRDSELLLEGRLESQAPEIDGLCLVNDSEVAQVQAGEFYTVRINRALGHDLLATIISEAAS
jgi:ribosomal protein S12 methylthiotransferase